MHSSRSITGTTKCTANAKIKSKHTLASAVTYTHLDKHEQEYTHKNTLHCHIHTPWQARTKIHTHTKIHSTATYTHLGKHEQEYTHKNTLHCRIYSLASTNKSTHSHTNSLHCHIHTPCQARTKTHTHKYTHTRTQTQSGGTHRVNTHALTHIHRHRVGGTRKGLLLGLSAELRVKAVWYLELLHAKGSVA